MVIAEDVEYGPALAPRPQFGGGVEFEQGSQIEGLASSTDVPSGCHRCQHSPSSAWCCTATVDGVDGQCGRLSVLWQLLLWQVVPTALGVA